MDLPNLFEQFVQAGLYLRGWSQKTPAIYQRAFSSFRSSGATTLGQKELQAWVVKQRQRGLSTAQA